MDFPLGVREWDEQRMSLQFLAWATGRAELQLSELGRTVGIASFAEEEQAFSFEYVKLEMSIRHYGKVE